MNGTSPIVRSGRWVVAALMLMITLAPSWQKAAAQSGPKAGTTADPVILTFSTVGDSRQDPVSPDPSQMPVSPQDQIWLENTKAFSRILSAVANRPTPAVTSPNLFVFDGDMIMGYGWATVPTNNTTVAGIVNSDLMAFYRQYGFWRGMIAPATENNLYVVPVAGNHETQYKAGGKKAKVENENAWRANMSDIILDDARFQRLFGVKPTNENTGNNAALDNLSTDQSKLSYSFDLQGVHFVVLNTDPTGNDSHAPTNFLKADLQAAVVRGVKHIYVFGHKPAYTYYYGKTTALPTSPSGLDVDIPARDAFWDVIEQYGATYFCGHEHIYNISVPRASTGGKAVQVLVGSGGSPFEATPSVVTINPATDRDYAWVTVNVYQSGKVTMTAYGFDDHFGPTKVLGTYLLP